LYKSVTVPDGLEVPIGGYLIFNVDVNFFVRAVLTTVFVTAKNLFDKVYVADRVRGIIPGSPRLIHAGFTQRF
jgi:Fe(3+) dicitrate transport protein